MRIVIAALMLVLVGCGASESEKQKERTFVVEYENVRVEGVAATTSDVAAEKAKVESALRLAK